MSLEGIISIVIAILGVGIGIPSLIIAISRKKYPKRLEFYVLDLVRIISPFVKKYGSIKLLHDGKETKNVSFIKGMCVSSGDEDIVLESRTQKGGMQVLLPAEYKWLEVHIQARSEGLNVSAEIDTEEPNILNISSELFKRDEVFTFDAYIEGEKENRLKINEINISHRIEGAEKVEPRYVSVYGVESKKRSFRSLIYLCIAAIVTMASTTFLMVHDRPIRYVDKNDAETNYTAAIITPDTISVSKGADGVWPWNCEQYTLEEFKLKFEINVKQRTVSYDFLIKMGVIFILFILAVIGFAIYVRHRMNRDKKVVDVYNKITKIVSDKDNIKQSNDK